MDANRKGLFRFPVAFGVYFSFVFSIFFCYGSLFARSFPGFLYPRRTIAWFGCGMYITTLRNLTATVPLLFNHMSFLGHLRWGSGWAIPLGHCVLVGKISLSIAGWCVLFVCIVQKRGLVTSKPYSTREIEIRFVSFAHVLRVTSITTKGELIKGGYRYSVLIFRDCLFVIDRKERERD